VTSLLGTVALWDGLEPWDWLTLTLLFGIGTLIVFMLWPYYNFTFRFDPRELLAKYVDSGVHITLSKMHQLSPKTGLLCVINTLTVSRFDISSEPIE
jgi:hypothetical protein